MSSHQQLNDLQRAQIERRFDNCTEEMMHLREIRRLTNDFLKQAETQEPPIYGQQPTTKKEKQREYYYLRLQFLDVRLQTLTEEMDQLQTQKNQIEVDQKTPAELTIQECDQIIATMTQELKKLKTQEDVYQAYLQNTPDTPEMEHNRHQYAQGLRLLQIRIKKLQDQLEQVKYGRYLKQVDGEYVTPPPAQQLPYPKFTKTYYPDTSYK